MKRMALRVIWPAFFTAGVLDAMVFAVLDPRDLRWFGGTHFGWSPVAVHSMTFLIFWAAITAATATTALLLLSDAEVNAFGTLPADGDARDVPR